jgi:hypothetical protein
MATPGGGKLAEELDRLRAEVDALHARLAELEAFVGLGRRAGAPPPAEAGPDLAPPDMAPPAPTIEPGEPWGLKPRGAAGEP